MHSAVCSAWRLAYFSGSDHSKLLLQFDLEHDAVLDVLLTEAGCQFLCRDNLHVSCTRGADFGKGLSRIFKIIEPFLGDGVVLEPLEEPIVAGVRAFEVNVHSVQGLVEAL